MERSVILFLDFDGVICDSAAEALPRRGPPTIRPIAGNPHRTDRGGAQEILRMRPLIRSGADFI